MDDDWPSRPPTERGGLEATPEAVFTPTRVLASRHVGDIFPGAVAAAR